MTITIYEAKQVEITSPAYFRQKGENLTNWYCVLSPDGKGMTTTHSENFEGNGKIIFSGTEFEPCSPDEFFCALAANTATIIAKQQAIAKKWGLISLQLGGTPC
jgi:hypothetical protein